MELKVSEKGRDRVRREKRKNVHAMLAAKKIKSVNKLTKISEYEDEEIFYDPYKHDSFVDKDLNPLYELDEVLCLDNKIYQKLRI